MTQVDMNVPGETTILLEVNGKQYESRLIVENPAGADGSTVVTPSASEDTEVYGSSSDGTGTERTAGEASK